MLGFKIKGKMEMDFVTAPMNEHEKGKQGLTTTTTSAALWDHCVLLWQEATARTLTTSQS